MRLKTIFILALFTLFISRASAQEETGAHVVDSIIQLHGNVLIPHASVLGEDAFINILRKYRVNKPDVERLKQLCINREVCKYIFNYLPMNPLTRVLAKERADSLYQDSINMLLIPENYHISGHAISLALCLADFLKLPEKSRSALMDSALDFARRRRKNPYANFAVDEVKVLRKYIKPDDLWNIYVEKNKEEAIRRSHAAWDTLRNANLTYELDSDRQVVATQFYYEKEMTMRDMYVDNEVVCERNLSDLYKSRTKLIVMYDAYMAKKRIRKENERKVVGDEYTW
ncbi:MAG: hypothetical protein IKO36_02485 [Bacteroidaceae bacterium]|nr:hypothetical protein [Bacteroidaceae bacterium]